MKTYGELLAAIRRYSDKSTDPQWSASLADFPSLVEAKVRKRLRLGAQERTAYIITVDTKTAYTVPPLFQSPRFVGYRGAPVEGQEPEPYRPLTWRNTSLLEDMRRHYRGAITDYTFKDGQIVLPANPETSGSLHIVFVEGIAPLSEDNVTNWLLQDYPDVYLAGCMVESLKFQKGEDMQGQKAEWFEDFNRELAALSKVDIYDRWSSHSRRKVRANAW